MSHIVRLAQNDSHPLIRIIGKHAQRGQPLGFDTAQILSVEFRATRKPHSADEFPEPATIVGPATGTVSADGLSITLEYDPSPTDLDEAGEFIFKFVVTLVGGEIISFPNTRKWPELHIAPSF
jgi:hypothetical protein